MSEGSESRTYQRRSGVDDYFDRPDRISILRSDGASEESNRARTRRAQFDVERRRRSGSFGFDRTKFPSESTGMVRRRGSGNDLPKRRYDGVRCSGYFGVSTGLAPSSAATRGAYIVGTNGRRHFRQRTLVYVYARNRSTSTTTSTVHRTGDVSKRATFDRSGASSVRTRRRGSDE